MESVANTLVAQLARTEGSAPRETWVAPAAAPNELAAARFAAIMNAPEVAPVAVAAEPSAALASVSATSETRGDRMLASLQGVSEDFRNTWTTLQTELQSDQSMSLRDMMNLQLQVTQMSVQFELLGKVVSRSTQNFDQLVRVQ
ncbi:type III secretion system inner rod subunit SctI [Ottowia thiooxydans]|uniref:Type III secretion protein I n=1 Tax=Ottowia thiooxydans TaxID=219182 RepID=A0ABV2QGD7_9BURK